MRTKQIDQTTIQWHKTSHHSGVGENSLGFMWTCTSRPTAYDKVKYLFTLVDDYTHFSVVYGLKSKSEVNTFKIMKQK